MLIASGRPQGRRLKLKELRELVNDDADMQRLTLEEQEELKDELVAHRSLKTEGARPSNRSAALDYRTTVERINTEVRASTTLIPFPLLNLCIQMTNLSERTGALAIAFFSRGHLDDDFEPNWAATLNATNFLQESLTLTPWDVARQLEQWGCCAVKRTLLFILLSQFLMSYSAIHTREPRDDAY